MAAANDSQGLKIAVAVFVTLSVILAVSTYFAYSEYAKADAKYTKAESDAAAAKKAQSEALNQLDGLSKEVIGARAQEYDAIRAEVKKALQKNDERLNELIAQVDAAVDQAKASGAQGQELEDAKAKVRQLAASIRTEPNKTQLALIDRLTDLISNSAMLSTRLALNYVDVKRNLEVANAVNAQKLEEQVKAYNDAKADLTAEHEKHIEDRQSLVTRVEKYDTDNSEMTTQIAGLNAKIREMEDDYTKRLALAQQTIRDLRDRVERTETVLDRPDGVLTYVDYARGEVHTNLTRGKGARPQMKMAIFDRNSPGLPTDRPKGSIELIAVSETEAIGRILKTEHTNEPLRIGDLVYSPAWSPNEPMQFALIGKIDINRDGKDDRQDLKRMIESAGGIVSYDLPPADAGKESGKLTGREAWYVIDERLPFREVYSKSTVTMNENAENLKHQSEMIREARLNGIRPMPIERLLPYLGYDYLAPTIGRAEALDIPALKRVLAPKHDQEAPKPISDETAPNEEMK